AIADGSGDWNFTAGALPDGVYDVAAMVTPTANQPGPLVPLVPGNRLVIDTAPPVAISAQLDRQSGTVVVTFRDQLSGLDPNSLLNPTSYALTVAGRFRAYPTAVTTVQTSPVAPDSAVAVALRFDGPARLWVGRPSAAIALGVITDRAGNPLATR